MTDFDFRLKGEETWPILVKKYSYTLRILLNFDQKSN